MKKIESNYDLASYKKHNTNISPCQVYNPLLNEVVR